MRMKTLFAQAALMVCVLLEKTAAHIIPGITCIQRPNIVFILVDDLGWNDMNLGGTRDPAFYTPTIDRLHRLGIRMLSTYTAPNCSPSRHALLSGSYPYRYGNQDNGISASTTGHIPLSMTILPQKLKQLNYRTHMIGKWHVGYCAKEQTPINRGFDTWEGFYLAAEDHFSHFGKKEAYDYRRAERPEGTPADVILDEGIPPPSETKDKYSTYLFSQRAVDIIHNHTRDYGNDGCRPFFILVSHGAIHGPNQVPTRYVTDTPCKDVPDIPKGYNKAMEELDGRRIKCGMMAALDEGVKNITDALKATGQLDNTLIVFTTDNGGSITHGSSNFPLRGGKTTLWEGGIRIPSFIYSCSSDILPHYDWDWKGLMFQTDWYPTMYGFASRNGDDIPEAQDGFNHWNRLVEKNQGSSRTEFAYMNEVQDWHAVLRQGKWKLLVNQTRYPGWYLAPAGTWDNPPAGVTYKEPKIKFLNSVQLFNIDDDPSETDDLTKRPPEDGYEARALQMLDRLNKYYWKELWVPTNTDTSRVYNPKTLNCVVPNYKPKTYVWCPGWC